MAKHRIQPISGIAILLLLALGSGYGIYVMARVTDIPEIGLQVVSRNIPVNTQAESTNYFNATYGVQLTPPERWTAVETTPLGLADTMLSVTFTDPATSDRLIFSIFKPSLKNTLRNSLSIINEKKALFGPLSADVWVGEDLKDGSAVTIVTAEDAGMLYEVTSYAPAATLDSFLSTFKIVQ